MTNEVRKIPRTTFVVGGLVAATFGLCSLAVTLSFVARHLGVGNPSAPMEHLLAAGLVFAGLPALLTGGGVARLVAHRVEERAEINATSLAHAAAIGAAAMGIASAGLAFLVAVPLGGLPVAPLRWLPLAGAGVAAGLATGLVIGGLVGARQLRHHQRRKGNLS